MDCKTTTNFDLLSPLNSDKRKEGFARNFE
jgi:hypothetical protein